MNPVQHIRIKVLGLSQTDLARRLGKHPSRLSRWEKRGFIPAEEQQGVRKVAKELGVEWSDSLFFEVPASPTSEAA